ncbi:MAG: CARDB domain-containing protein [Gaiellales bacterium]
MSVHDDDILDFDFVDDATRELPPPTRGPAPQPPAASRPGGGGGGSGGGSGGGGVGGRGPRRPSFSGAAGVAPLLRLVGLVVIAIGLVVLVAVWAQGCTGAKAQDTYTEYAQAMKLIADDSAKIGQDLAETLTTPGLQQADLETKLSGFVQQQQLDVQRARRLDPPGPLTPSHLHAIEALRFRVNGLQGLHDTFVETKSSKDQTAAGEALAGQGRRLETSDIVWADLFQEGFTAQAKQANVAVTPPASVFVTNTELYSARSMSAIFQRIHGASTGGVSSGAHGTAIEFVKATPANVQLSTDNETTLNVETDLGFTVGVTNSGESQEVSVQVTLTIPKQSNPIVKTATIDIIDPGETKEVSFTDFPDVPFGDGASIQVSTKPVPGETNTTNNSYEYPVIFTIPSR